MANFGQDFESASYWNPSLSRVGQSVLQDGDNHLLETNHMHQGKKEKWLKGNMNKDKNSMNAFLETFPLSEGP